MYSGDGYFRSAERTPMTAEAEQAAEQAIQPTGGSRGRIVPLVVFHHGDDVPVLEDHDAAGAFGIGNMGSERVEEDAMHDAVAHFGFQGHSLGRRRLASQVSEQIMQMAQMRRHNANDLEILIVGTRGGLPRLVGAAHAPGNALGEIEGRGFVGTQF